MSEEEKGNASFSKFGGNFQEKLAELILRERAFADQIEEVIKLEYFDYSYLQKFTEKVFDYRNQYDVHPSIDIMETVIKSDMDDVPEALKRKVGEFFVRIKSEGEAADVKDGDFVKDKSLDFCKKQDLKTAIVEAYELIEDSDYEPVEGVIKDALRRGQDNDVGHEYIKDFESRYDIRKRNPVTTGWKNIDSITSGGHGRGELGVCIGATGSGKSMALVHFGAAALQEGFNVVHYTLELRDRVIGSRYDACITNTPLDLLDKKKDDIRDAIKDVDGQLIVKEYPTGQASTQTIKRHLEKIQRRGIKVDAVIVDYADLLRPVNAQQHKRDNLQAIYEDLRGLAKEFEVAMWTASQTNRQGLNKEVITMEEISEAFNKCFVSDFIFTLSRTIDDKNMNTGRVFIAKNRNGPDGMVFPIFMDPGRVKIKVHDKGDPTMQKKMEKRKEEMGKDISNIFEKFKGK